MDNEKQVYADLRDKLISVPDAVMRMRELRWSREDAESEVTQWLEQWEFQQDHDEEKQDGWAAGD